MSTLFVDTINEKTTNNGIIIPSHVIQHKVHNLTTATNATGVNQTYTDLGGGSFSFTPKQSGSKLYITMINHVYVERSNTSWGAAVGRLVVDGNAQSEKGDGGSSNAYGVGIRDTDGSSSQTIRLMAYDTQQHEYTTTGTSAITIKGQFYCENVSDQIQFNKYGRGSITVLEVAQ